MITSRGGTIELEGYVSTLLADVTGIVIAMKSKGIPDDLIMIAVSVGLGAKQEDHKTEDDRLAKEFVEELMKQVKEKHEAREKHD